MRKERRTSPGRCPGALGTKKTDVMSGTDVGVFAWPGEAVLLLGLRFRQPVALVLDVNGDLGQRLGVLAAMVRTEKQLSRVSE
jgi:hypothetical protein